MARLHRLRLAAAVSEVSQGVRRIALKADVDNIDAWWRRVAEDVLALVMAGFDAARQLAEAFLVSHAVAEGREVEPVLAEWNRERAETSLRVTGPVAFKESIRAGNTPAVGRVAMANVLAGSAERLALAGERETVEATIEDSAEIVGWRRVGDGDPCAFCAMLISRGAVYKSGRTAGDIEFGGMEYHDNDGCSAVPLYEHEDEPEEVVDLEQQWLDVTEAYAGKDKLREWRKYWDKRDSPNAPELTRNPPTAGPVEPQRGPVQVASERMPVPEFAQPYHRDVDGLEDLARAVESGNFASEQRLTGGVSADTSLVTLPNDRKLVRKAGGNPTAEQAAAAIGAAVGVRVPRVYRNHPGEVWMDFINNAKTWDQLRASGADRARAERAKESDDGILIGLFDLMINNGDRNDGNWMLSDSGQVYAIDHGHAFAIPMAGRVPRAQIGWRGPFSEHFLADPASKRLGPNSLTSADIATIRERLTALEPDAKMWGQPRWLQHALAVLDAVEPFARGTRNLVAGVR